MNNKYKFKGKSPYDNKWYFGFYMDDRVIKTEDCEVEGLD